MSVIGTIIIGFIVGLLARLLHPGKDGLGIIMTTLLGVAGAMLATYGGQFFGLYRPGEPAGFIGAVVGAIIILFIVRRLRK
ncbi:GlsB/YeaQ/YmgE family stress response membrane protein [Aromatoleum bremense]|uniref:GlsB/YeaQ/YmgE family stress response membrane protein n=1 Tax=Aromatoleum bremense TaxID=76115 RepID=A0ABX1NT74_9RHOO|nr:GlsB/YeaQ/YmgE family stress response membrane protein [Aromatoleum bremense]NMG15208.1 GlsB/YeaQ/YmgE family stress response membrane protein [Aromatoleum bremense]QTQ32948.1 Transglycosylase-associated family protein [Aromatoleum bremense]